MSDYSIKGYDHWKLMSPDEEQDTRQLVGDCDCCEVSNVPLRQVWTCGLETWGCEDCT